MSPSHGGSIDRRHAGVTHRDRGSVRDRMIRLNGREPIRRARAQDMMRRVLGSNPSRFHGFPGLPSDSRIRHWISDDVNPLYRTDSLIQAKAAMGDPRSECELLVLWMMERVAEAYRDDPPGEIEELVVELAELDGAEDVARLAAATHGFATHLVVLARDRLREQIARAKDVLREYDRLLEERRAG